MVSYNCHECGFWENIRKYILEGGKYRCQRKPKSEYENGYGEEFSNKSGCEKTSQITGRECSSKQSDVFSQYENIDGRNASDQPDVAQNEQVRYSFTGTNKTMQADSPKSGDRKEGKPSSDTRQRYSKEEQQKIIFYYRDPSLTIPKFGED